MNKLLVVQRQLKAKRAYSNIKQDCFTMEHYGMLYDNYITNLLDHIITSQYVNNDEGDRADSIINKQATSANNEVSDSPQNQQTVISKHLYGKFEPPADRTVDPSRTKGYLAMHSTQFEFIGY